MKTYSAKESEVQKQWFVIDANEQVVGRVAEKIANVLRGKHKAIYAPHCDTGDNIIVVNADKAVFTGKKELNKRYMTYSGYVGGERYESAKVLRNRRPELIIERAVKGMVPHNRLGRRMLKKLHVYAGTEHPHEAQKPVPLAV